MMNKTYIESLNKFIVKQGTLEEESLMKQGGVIRIRMYVMFQWLK